MRRLDEGGQAKLTGFGTSEGTDSWVAQYVRTLHAIDSIDVHPQAQLKLSERSNS